MISRFDWSVGIVLEEADGSLFWLELIQDCRIVDADRLAKITKEADELTEIFAAIQHTTRTKSVP